jgi:hypothetical protein
VYAVDSSVVLPSLWLLDHHAMNGVEVLTCNLKCLKRLCPRFETSLFVNLHPLPPVDANPGKDRRRKCDGHPSSH